jgi:RHS repeat-associated protein
MDGTFFFPFFDHNGNVTAYVDAQGTVVASYTYDAFGNTIAQTGSMADAFPHRFSTKYFDADTGLYYYGYRFYSPELGRWLNRDPIGEQGGENLHGFVGNDGVDGFDNLGLKIEYTRKGESQVDVTCDCDESIATLAEHFHLAPDEVNSWLEVADGGGLPSDPEEKFDRERRFKVVNEVHVTQGDSGQRANVLPFLMKRKDVMIAHYREMKYKVVDDTPGDVTGENIDQILANLDSKHIYIWVHLGHGTTTYGNLALNDREPYNPLPLPLDHAPSSFTARHKLGEVVLFACAAGTKSADWKAQLVGPGGDLWATPDLIYVGTGLGWIGRPWNHKLRKY